MLTLYPTLEFKKIINTYKYIYINKGMRKTTSKYKGVSKRNGKWWARVHVDGNMKGVGMYDTELEAARAYDMEVLRLNLSRQTNFSYKKLANTTLNN
jgi:hypothetical protein